MKKLQVHDFYLKTEEVTKTLSAANKIYFKQLQDYMIMSSFFYDEIKIRELLYGMACDLADADRDGLTAQAYFGKKPQKMVRDILKHAALEKKRNLLTLAVYLMGIFWFYRFLSDFSSLGLVQINLFSYLSDALIGSLGIILFFQIVRFGIYYFSRFNRLAFKLAGEGITVGDCLTYFLGAVVLMSCVLIRIFADRYYPNYLTFQMHQPFGLLLVSVLTVVGLIFVWRNAILRPAVSPILGYLVTGFLKAATSAKFVRGIWPEVILPLAIIFVAYLIFLIWLQRNLKNDVPVF